MIVLDTNVISELTKEPVSPAVVSWAHAHADQEMWMTSTTVSELELGISLMPAGRRHAERDRTQTEIILEFRDRVIPFDADQAIVFAELVAHRRAAGRPISRADAQIAAACVSRNATLATRNLKDFRDIPGLDVVDPWRD